MVAVDSSLTMPRKSSSLESVKRCVKTDTTLTVPTNNPRSAITCAPVLKLLQQQQVLTRRKSISHLLNVIKPSFRYC